MPGYNQYRGNFRGKQKTKKRKNNARYRRRPVWKVPVELKPELKFLDLVVPQTSLTAVWASYDPAPALCLNGIGQGDSPTSRDGRAYFITSVMLKGLLQLNIKTEDFIPQNDIVIRMMLVHDTQTNKAQLTPADVVNATGSEFLAFRDLNFTTRYKVLKDKTFVFRRNFVNEGVITSFASNKGLIRFNCYHTFPTPIQVLCQGDGATIANITNDSIHLIATANSTEVNLEYTSRVRFRG